MEKCILMLGCFDTKGEDFSFLFHCLKKGGHEIITLNTGVMKSNVSFSVDFNNTIVAESGGSSLQALRQNNNRGIAIEYMSKGAAVIIANLVAGNRIKGIIGMGGGGGTFIALRAMQEVPFGIPKLCLTTLAANDLSRQVGVKDITLMSSVVDVAGVNSISRILIQQASAAICSMANVDSDLTNKKQKRIAVSMFGNTTICIEKCSELLKNKGFEIFAFHANGVGGATMESLIYEGFFDVILDVTTTELADDLCGGICSAGPERLTAASEMGVPQIVVPGCLDMVNFAHVDTVPEHFNSRKFYSWAPDVTLMRTDIEENIILGERLAKKLNASTGAVKILLPIHGISQLDKEGEVFYDIEKDLALFNSIQRNVNNHIEVKEIDAHINDEIFALELVNQLIKIIVL